MIFVYIFIYTIIQIIIIRLPRCHLYKLCTAERRMQNTSLFLYQYFQEKIIENSI